MALWHFQQRTQKVPGGYLTNPGFYKKKIILKRLQIFFACSAFERKLAAWQPLKLTPAKDSKVVVFNKESKKYLLTAPSNYL